MSLSKKHARHAIHTVTSHSTKTRSHYDCEKERHEKNEGGGPHLEVEQPSSVLDRPLQNLMETVVVETSGRFDRDNQEVGRVGVHRRPRKVAHQDIGNDLRLKVNDELLQSVRNLVDWSDELKLSLDFSGQGVERERLEAGDRKLGPHDEPQLPGDSLWAKDLVPLLKDGKVGLFDKTQLKTEKQGINKSGFNKFMPTHHS